jgi:DNA-binding NtrC family response regulator
MNKPQILLIDDEAIALTNLTHVLKREGYDVTACKDGEAGLEALERSDFDLVLTDLKMPGIDGMAVLRQVHASHPDVPVIMITGHATLDSAVEAMKAGAHHYLAKPFRLAEAREVVRSALEMRRIKRENQELRLRVEQLQNPHTIITQDLGMQRLLETARRIATTDSSVVIHGESGTGKELLARYIHQSSRRAEGPFRRFQLRRAVGRSGGERAVRPREGRLHRRAGTQDRPVRGSERRHAVPR